MFDIILPVDRVCSFLFGVSSASKQHYAYEKLGSCALLVAIEPLTGLRFSQVHPRRTKLEYTLFCQAVAAKYPDALKIRLIQDNLNTHTASAFYDHLPAEEAFALAQRFEFIYTPPSARWLNMIECEFSVLSRLCLNRRIPTLDLLRSEVLAVLEERSRKQIKIVWQFSLQAARSMLNTHYTRVHPQICTAVLLAAWLFMVVVFEHITRVSGSYRYRRTYEDGFRPWELPPIHRDIRTFGSALRPQM